jgi:CYTH domain-containing protein
MYLTEAEYNLFEALGAKTLTKRRYTYIVQNHAFSIDVFEGCHQGLILAEMESDNKTEPNELVLSSFVLKEVTNDPFFTGGNLANMTEAEFKQGVSQRIRDYEKS